MATILPFVPRVAATTVRLQRDAVAIIIFPGVRYERISTGGPLPNRPKPRPAHR